MSEITQIRNNELVDLLSVDFQKRFEPNLAWKSACAQFLALTGLRGFWPMSSFDENGDAFDLSGQGRTLSYNGNPTYNYSSLIPYIDLDGTGDYLSRADEAGLDILGTETYVAGAVRGLTFGGWFWLDTLAPGFDTGFIGKWTAAGNQRAYLIYFFDGGDTVNFVLSNTGAGGAGSVQAAGPVISASTWYFLVGRFEPTTAVRLFVNGTWYSNATAFPSVFNSNADFMIGAHNAGANPMDGRASLCFLCAAALSDAIVSALFQQTRAMFNV